MAPEPVPFGRYRLLNLLGEGGMAKVFRAVLSGPMGFEKEVALKRIDPKMTQDERVVKALINEARLGGQLRHKNIVEIYEFNQIDGNYFMAMEYVDGWTLDTLIRRCRGRQEFVPGTVVVEILGAVCRGLDYAHNLIAKDGQPLNLVHRDLKPGNIILSRDGDVKIMDFGIAKADTNLYKTTAADVTKGTPIYMSPEQVTGSRLDHRSDIFSLGSILHELVTLQVPFGGDNLLAIMHAILNAEIAAPRERVRKLEPALEPILARCMARDRGERFQSVQELGQALRDSRRLVRPGPTLQEWLEDLAAALPPATATGEFGPDGAPTPLQGKPAEGTISLEVIGNTTEEPPVSPATVAGRRADSGPAEAPDPLGDTREVPTGSPQPIDADSSLDPSEQRFLKTDGSGPGPVSPDLTRTRLQKSVPGQAQPRRRRRRKSRAGAAVWLAVAGIGILILGAFGLGIQVLLGPGAQTGTGADGPTPTVEPAATPVPTATAAATPVDVPVTPGGATTPARGQPTPFPPPTPAIRATPTPRPSQTPRPLPTAEPTPKVGAETPAPAAAGVGTVRLNSVPWSTVTVDGRSLGSSPVIGYKLPAGPHTVVFDCSACEPPRKETVDIVVVSGQETKKIVRFDQE